MAQPVFFTRTFAFTSLDLMVADVPMDGAKLALFKNQPTLTPTMVPGDFTPPVFTGYAAADVVWSDPYSTPQDVVQVESQEKLWVATALPAEDTTVYGWYLTNAGGTAVIAAAYLDEPVPINQIGDGVHAQAVLPFKM